MKEEDNINEEGFYKIDVLVKEYNSDQEVLSSRQEPFSTLDPEEVKRKIAHQSKEKLIKKHNKSYVRPQYKRIPTAQFGYFDQERGAM